MILPLPKRHDATADDYESAARQDRGGGRTLEEDKVNDLPNNEEGGDKKSDHLFKFYGAKFRSNP